MAKMQLVFGVMLDEFEWPALEVCSVGIGLLSFSSIGFHARIQEISTGGGGVQVSLTKKALMFFSFLFF